MRKNMADEQELEASRIQEVRQRFFQEKGILLNEFDEQDLNRVRHDDLWVRCFVRARGHDIDKALQALVFCLKWRKSYCLNDITERSLDRRMFEAGFLYPHNRDKEGNSIILFVGRNYKKDPQQHPELKRFLVYLLEKHRRIYPSKKIMLLFDMQETGLANMDMEFVKFIITCFTNYFPNNLAWLVVVELPWILSAAWKIVKTWLSPDAVSKIKFLSKSELQDYIDEDKLLVKLGGMDPYEYSYPQTQDDLCLGEPEREAEDFDLPNISESIVESSDGVEEADEPQSLMLSLDEPDAASPVRKVKFEDEIITAAKPSLNASPSAQLARNRETELQKSSLKSLLPTKQPTRSNPSKEPISVGDYLIITPAEELAFTTSSTSPGTEILQTLSLENNSLSRVAFKVKTTSPESYRVRPSSGVITPGSSADVNVFLQPGHAASVSRDKFLVMSTSIAEGSSAAEIAAVWRKVPKSSIVEHRLRCRFDESGQESSSGDAGLTNMSSTADSQSVGSLKDHLQLVEKKLDQISRKVSYIDEGLQVFIKVQLALFSGMVILFAVVFYYAFFLMN